MLKIGIPWTWAWVAVSIAFGVACAARPAQAALSGQKASNSDATVTYQYSWSGSTVVRRDVFIDADQGPSGYGIGGIFAEYLVQDGSLYKFSGTNSGNWAWTRLKAVTFAAGPPATWNVTRADIGENGACSESSSLVFRTENSAGNTVDISAPYTETFTPSSSCTFLKLGVASYFGLGTTDWTNLEASGSQVSFALVNPASGPGPSKSSAWAQEMQRLRSAGISVYGYIKSRQAGVGTQARVASDYVNDIDRWYIWYGQYLTGLFIDEEYPNCASNLGPNGEMNFNESQYYKNIIAYMKQSRNAYSPSGGVKIILNPGSRTQECMFRVNNTADPTQDIVQANFESTYNNYASFGIAAGSWELNYPASKFWHLVHTVTNTRQLQDVVAQARTPSKHVGNIYATDETSDQNFVGCMLNGQAYGTWNLLPGRCHGDTSYWPLLKQLTD